MRHLPGGGKVSTPGNRTPLYTTSAPVYNGSTPVLNTLMSFLFQAGGCGTCPAAAKGPS